MPKVTALTESLTIADSDFLYAVIGGNSRKIRKDTLIPPAVAASDIALQTAVAGSGQTFIDFTGVPSWVNRVTGLFAGLSTNGTSEILVQLGDSGGIENTGYNSTFVGFSGAALGHTSSTAGFRVSVPTAASNIASGRFTLSRVSGNLWVLDGVLKRTTTDMGLFAGDKELTDTLTQVRITTANGTDTFDAGSVTISWE